MKICLQFLLTFGLMISALAIQLPRATATQGSEDGCTRPCFADEDEGLSGTLPPGVFLDVDCEVPSNGVGYDPGCSTCTACKMKVTVSFNGFGGGYCISVDTGTGWNTPIGLYARPGRLVTNCNAVPSFFSIRVGLCNLMPATGEFQWDHVLNCSCSW